ncbi:hypothetical protein KEM52_005516 [Ascosphaera acerosa]|nr:hypothetical protein KEM52_005516 [Ascosphaera acerosa]
MASGGGSNASGSGKMIGPEAPLTPTYVGYVSSTQDALILFEGAFRGSLLSVHRRPHDRERAQVVRSGACFIYEEGSSGIRRWTDGITWSPSRILGNFLVYRELDKPFPPGEKKRAMKKLGKRGIGRHEPYARPESVSVGADGGSSPGGGPVTAGLFHERPHQPEIERALVGSLVDSYGFKEDGLVKKTISVMMFGVPHHMVTYYNVEDVLSGRLRSPSFDPELRVIRPRPELLKQSFRAPISDIEIAASALAESNAGSPLYRQPVLNAAAAAGYTMPNAAFYSYHPSPQAQALPIASLPPSGSDLPTYAPPPVRRTPHRTPPLALLPPPEPSYTSPPHQPEPASAPESQPQPDTSREPSVLPPPSDSQFAPPLQPPSGSPSFAPPPASQPPSGSPSFAPPPAPPPQQQSDEAATYPTIQAAAARAAAAAMPSVSPPEPYLTPTSTNTEIRPAEDYAPSHTGAASPDEDDMQEAARELTRYQRAPCIPASNDVKPVRRFARFHASPFGFDLPLALHHQPHSHFQPIAPMPQALTQQRQRQPPEPLPLPHLMAQALPPPPTHQTPAQPQQPFYNHHSHHHHYQDSTAYSAMTVAHADSSLASAPNHAPMPPQTHLPSQEHPSPPQQLPPQGHTAPPEQISAQGHLSLPDQVPPQGHLARPDQMPPGGHMSPDEQRPPEGQANGDGDHAHRGPYVDELGRIWS